MDIDKKFGIIIKMINVSNFANKEYLKGEIKKQLDFLLFNTNFKNPNIKIHINAGDSKDFPRMFFSLYTLGRLKKNNLLDISLDDLLIFGEGLYDKSIETDLKVMDKLTLKIYYMRFLNIFSLDYTKMLEEFKKEKYNLIYTNPVLMYLFCCLYFDSNIRKEWQYSNSIFWNCLKNFDFLIFSNIKTDQQIFAFSEVSFFKNLVPSFLYEEVKIFYDNLTDIKIKNTSSSGIAKCLEHFGRVDDFDNYKKFLKVLETRSVSSLNQEYINPNLLKFKSIFTENDDSQYICLDTNTHLINAYLNIYERKN